MKPNIDKMISRADALWQGTQYRIMQDVIRRIKKTKKITSTADYQINRLVEMGKTTEQIEKTIKEAIDATWPEMFELYDEVSNWEYVRNKDIYEQINARYIPPEKNQWLQNISEAIKKQTKDSIVNLAQSYGFSVMMGTKRVFMPFAAYYQKYVDEAIMDVLVGGFDYSTVIRRIVTQMTNSGLRTVDYASGRSNRVDVAVRRAVMTGFAQLTGKINEHNAAELGTEYFETDWHPAARPTHREWQGKVYHYKDLQSVCGLGTVAGLCGANCRHEYHPFVKGISQRMYSDQWLSEQNHREEIKKTWNGKELDAYEQTQQQRKMETAMRAQRERVELLKEADADPDDVMIARAKYQAQLNEYGRFCKKMGLQKQRERIYYDMRGKIATNTKEQNRKYTADMIRNAERDSKQYYRYKNIIGANIGSLEKFRQMKYNEPEKFSVLKKRVDTYSEIDKKDWSSEFKRKSKEAYARFEKEGIYLSVHALSRLSRLNKPGYPSIEESDVLTIVKGNPNYSEGESKLIFFDLGKQLVVVKNKETDDIVSIVRRKMPKEVWERV